MVPKRSRILGLPAAIAIAAVLLLAMPGAASAADTYADASRPDNSEDCLTPATACQTIGGVDGALSKSGPGDTTYVADGTYAEALTLDAGKSLASLDSTNPKPLIDGGGLPPILVDAGGAGSISGLHLLSDGASVLIGAAGSVDISDNLFDEDNLSDPSGYGFDVLIDNASGVLVHDNTFEDPDASGAQMGVGNQASDSVIADNTFSGFAAGVGMLGGEPQVAGNQFSGAHPDGFFTSGAGVIVVDGDPTIAQNTIGAPSQGPSVGILVLAEFLGSPGATLSRNEISAQDVGVHVGETTLPVTLSNDLIHDNAVGLQAADTTAPFTEGDVSIINETIYNNSDTDIRLDNSTLTMDSSVVGTPIDLVGGNGDCEISFSGGPSTPVANGCDDFRI